MPIETKIDKTVEAPDLLGKNATFHHFITLE